MLRKVILTILALTISFAVFGLEAAEKMKERKYSLPKHGKLVLTVPQDWKSEVRQPGMDLPPTITFSPAAGDRFSVLMTPGYSMTDTLIDTSQISLRIKLDAYVKERILPGSEESQIALKPINGASGRGWYFFATDKAPKPGEFKYMVQAWVVSGQLLIVTTVLTHEKDCECISQVLIALGSAVHRE